MEKDTWKRYYEKMLTDNTVEFLQNVIVEELIEWAEEAIGRITKGEIC